MRKVPLVDRQNTLRLDRPVQTVKCRCVQITRLVVHARHNGIGRVHDTAHNKTTCRATRDM